MVIIPPNVYTVLFNPFLYFISHLVYAFEDKLLPRPTCRGWTAKPSLPSCNSAPEAPGHYSGSTFMAFQRQCPKASHSKEFPETYYLALKDFLFYVSSDFSSNACTSLYQTNLKILATQSVSHRPAASGSLWLLIKCRLSGPTPDLQIQDLHFNKVPADLHAH